MSEYAPDITQAYMEEARIAQQSLMQRMRSEEGSIKGFFAGMVTMGLLAGAGFLALKGRLPSLPEQVGTPQGSEIKIKTVAVKPQDYECTAINIYDVGGSKGRVTYGGLDFTGYGSHIEKGKIKMDTCAPSSAVKVEKTVQNGEPNINVTVDVTKMAFDASFIEKETHVVPVNPPLSQIGNGIIDAGSGVLRGGCRVVQLGDKCDALNAISKWDKDNQEDLRRALQIEVLKQTREKAGPAEWKNQMAAIEQTYEKQAIDQGVKPERAADAVDLHFVDDKGKPTTAVPDFTRDTIQELYDQGVLDPKGLGGPQLKVENITVNPLPGPNDPR